MQNSLLVISNLTRLDTELYNVLGILLNSCVFCGWRTETGEARVCDGHGLLPANRDVIHGNDGRMTFCFVAISAAIPCMTFCIDDAPLLPPPETELCRKKDEEPRLKKPGACRSSRGATRRSWALLDAGTVAAVGLIAKPDDRFGCGDGVEFAHGTSTYLSRSANAMI
jgi:hypothetical protein